MDIKLNKLILCTNIFILVISHGYTQDTNNIHTLKVIDVDKILLGKYKEITTFQLGDINFLRFEVISTVYQKDSTLITFVIWTGPYSFYPINTSENGEKISIDVKFLDTQKSPFLCLFYNNSVIKYKVTKKNNNIGYTDTLIKMVLKRGKIYNLIFDVNNFHSIYIKIKSP